MATSIGLKPTLWPQDTARPFRVEKLRPQTLPLNKSILKP